MGELRWFLFGLISILPTIFFISVTVAEDQNLSPFLMPKVTVVGVLEPLDDKSVLTKEQIKVLPKGKTGSINELLTLMPSIQAGELANTSLQGGEIAPPNISISGGKVYDNNFMIDGMGVNNLIDPLNETSLFGGTLLPGEPQSIFMSPSLVDEVVVYDSNVSAEFNGFTGGVVDARTISPGSTFSGHLRYKTTRDKWTEFHVDDQDQENFEESNSSTRQPKFNKQEAEVLLKVPLFDRDGIVTSYSIFDSRITLKHLDEDKDQSRTQENFFFKYEKEVTAFDQLSFSVNSQVNKADYFYTDAYKSDFTIDKKVSNLQLDYQHLFDVGEFDLKLGYLQSDKERDAPQHLFLWRVSPSKPWGALVDSSTSREGMLGSLEEQEQDFQLKAKFTTEPVKTGPFSHIFKVGADYERTKGSSTRNEDSYQYYSAVLNSSVHCEEGAIDCIEGEQYFTRRIVFQAGSVTSTMDTYSFFLEDLMQWKRLELRPGLNVSYNDFMKNTDYGPRLATSYDLFGDHSSILIAGLNRYYGKTLLAYKIREASKPNLTQKWPFTDADTISYGTTSYKYSELKTPYTDEFVAGLDQRVLAGVAKLRYVKRNGENEFAQEKDEIAREDGIKYYSLNNNGSTNHEEYSIEWNRTWQKHYFSINTVYQETDTSNENYSDKFDDIDASNLCWFDGSTLPCSELPRRDYNRPWVINLIYSVNLPYNLTFTNHAKYRSGYIGLDSLNSSEREELGVPEEVTLAYGEEKQPESWIFNWRLDWRRNIYRSHGIRLSLEINNVFDQKVPAGEYETIQTYEMGRQFWAEMEYYF